MVVVSRTKCSFTVNIKYGKAVRWSFISFYRIHGDWQDANVGYLWSHVFSRGWVFWSLPGGWVPTPCYWHLVEVTTFKVGKQWFLVCYNRILMAKSSVTKLRATVDVTSNVQVGSSVMKRTACNDRIIMNLVTGCKWDPMYYHFTSNPANFSCTKILTMCADFFLIPSWF